MNGDSSTNLRHPAPICAAVVGALLAWCPCVFALNPALDLTQYAHTAWKIGDGFLRGPIGAMAQTPDGYLWLGTEFGLLRFDGVRAIPWQPPAGEQLASNYIRSLLVTRDGTLWIGALNGLANWKDGKLTRFPKLAGMTVDTLLEDHEGTVWAGGFTVPSARLCAIRTDGSVCFGEDGTLGTSVESLYQDGWKNVWAATSTGLWRWAPGPPTRYTSASPILSHLHSLIGGDRQSVLVATDAGIEEFVHGKSSPYSLPGIGRQLDVHGIFRDRDGAMWVGIRRGGGLAHVHDGRTDLFSVSNGLSGDSVHRFFEDREGSIWVATNDGLDRFHAVTVVRYSAGQGLSSSVASAVLADRLGSVLISTDAGLDRWKAGRIGTFDRKGGKLNGDTPIALFEDSRGRIFAATRGEFGYLAGNQFVPLRQVPNGVNRAIAQDRGRNLWIVNQSAGLIKLSPQGTARVVPWDRLGHKDFAIAIAGDSSRNGIWLGFYNGGILHFDDETRASYAVVDGLGRGAVAYLRVDGDGTVWAATEGGLSRLKNGRIATLSSKNGLPCDAVRWAIEDDQRFLWLEMPCGLVRVARSDLDAWANVSDQDAHRVQTIVFDSSDGLRPQGTIAGYTPQVTRAADGKLWFTGQGGASVVDPLHLSFNTQPPPVHVEQIMADRQRHDAASDGGRQLHLPPSTRDLQIDYNALSLVAPEKNSFRIKLEGWDREWQDVGNRRQAFYNNLPPRNYRFRVIASNNSGVWNEAGAALDFSIAPAYYQTTWFRAMAALALLALMWVVYQYRVRQVAYEFETRLQERVNERTRIARELHDTLLQSFHGLLFRFQAATNRLPESEVKKQFESAIDQAAQAITEGRDAVQNLRASTAVTNDLAEAIGTLGDELAASQSADPGATPAVVNVSVEGTPRNLHPILRDDIYRIAGEALRNAFRHSNARHIEVEIRYDAAQLQVRVRDDGNGIDPKMLDEPRQGHFGLPGMRERAGLIGGRLELWSKPGLGTEVELTIPAAAVYAAPRARSRPWWFARRTGTDT